MIENIELKQSIFADLEKHCRADCILSTNTSTIDLNLVGAKTKSQDRIIGAHFFRLLPSLSVLFGCKSTQHGKDEVPVGTVLSLLLIRF